MTYKSGETENYLLKQMNVSSKIHCIEDARYYARRRMPKILFDYVDGAAGSEIAKQKNTEQLDQLRLQPRVLVNVNQRKLKKTFLGESWNLPFGIAPMGMCNLTCPGADLMLARAARHYKIPMALSTMSSTSLEVIAEQSAGHAWFQLYVGQSQQMAFELVERAKSAGFKTLVLTVDVPQVAPRIRDLKNGFKAPLKIGVKQFIDFAIHPHWSISTLIAGAPQLANFEPGSFDRDAKRGKVDWDFLDRLRDSWKHNLIVKGVTCAQDALKIKQAGVNAIYVSNHGGRQLDSAPAAIKQLPLIRQAVGSDFPLIFDSGVQNGEAVIKALACGANFVMLGRAILYGLGADQERGLMRVIDLIEAQISLAMAQLGCDDIENINSEVLLES